MCAIPVRDGHYFGKRLNRSQGMRPEKLHGFEIRIYKCSNCQLVYPNPVPVSLDKGRYVVPMTEQFWEERDHVHKEHFKYELSVLQRLIKKPLNTLTVLDIGFGLGSSLVTMTPAFKEVHGIEAFKGLYDKTLDTRAGQINAGLLQHVRFEDAHYEKEQFDFIFFEALQHLPDLDAALKKALAWLKPGGIMYMEVPSSSYLFHQLINIVYKLKGGGYVINTNPMHGNFSYYEFSKRSFVESGKRLGYKVIYNQVFECIPPLPKVLAKLMIFVMKYTKTGMQQSIWVQKEG